MKTRLLSLLLLIVWCASFVLAQEPRPLSERIRDSVAKHQKRWKLEANDKVPAMAQAGFDLFYLQWQDGRFHVDALMWVHYSVDDAKKQFSEGFEHNFSLMRKVDKSVPNLAADNYLLKGTHSDEWQRGVIFRKGRVFVYVSAHSEENAAKLASYIVAEIDP